MNTQEMFSKIVTHLRAQGKPSINPDMHDSCMYRSKDGCMCAVGVLMTDEHYDDGVETRHVGGPLEVGPFDRPAILEDVRPESRRRILERVIDAQLAEQVAVGHQDRRGTDSQRLFDH